MRLSLTTFPKAKFVLANFVLSSVIDKKSYDIDTWAQCHKTFLSVIEKFRNKLECLYLASFSSLA